MHAAIIPADPEQMITFRDLDDGALRDEIDAITGTPAVPVTIERYAMTMFAAGGDEERPANHRATVLCNWAETRNRPDTIRGDVVLLGPAVAGGHAPIVDNHKWWLIRFDNSQTEAAGLGTGD
jgi:hypothetical protein